MQKRNDRDVSTAEARNEFSELVNRVSYGKERRILTRRGKPMAAVVPLEDLEVLEELERRVDLDEARKALREAEKEGTVPWEELKGELGL